MARVTVTTEAIREHVPLLARAIAMEAVSRHPRPVAGLQDSIEAARREIESYLRGFGCLDVVLRGRASPQWEVLVARADNLLPRPCVGCGAPVWPECRPRGSPSFRCASCWEKFVRGARLVARAETDVEVQAGLRMAGLPVVEGG
jgi:hypothetical protein